jgi:hypothetical protein
VAQQPNSFEVLKNLRKLESDDPAERGRAIVFLSKLQDDPRVRDMLQYSADSDPDARVRQLASRAVQAHPAAQPARDFDPDPSPDLAPPSGSPDAFWAAAAGAPVPAKLSPSGPAALGEIRWDCVFCGTQDITTDACPNCGATREAGRESPVKSIAAERLGPLPSDRHEKPFIFYPHNVNYVRGKTDDLSSQNIGGCMLAGAGVLFVALAALFIFVVLPEWNRSKKLDADGVTVQGVVESRRDEWSEDDNSYFITYRFYASETGRSYQREQSVGANNYRRWTQGTPVEVRYLPSDPSVSELVDDNTEDTGRTVLVVGLIVIGAVLLIVAIVGWDRYLAGGSLEKRGRFLRGEVIQGTLSTDADGDLILRLRYCFKTPDGKVITRTVSRPANDMRGRQAPPPGRSVAVLFLNRHNFEIM